MSFANNNIDRPAASGADSENGLIFEQPAQHARLVSATYSVQVGRISAYANGFHDLVSRGTGFFFGVTVPLGVRSSVTASAVSDSGRLYGEAQSSQSAAEVGDFGYQLYAPQGSQSHQFGNLQYKSPWALFSADPHRHQPGPKARQGAQGAISAADGAPLSPPAINSAFVGSGTNGAAGGPGLR